MTIEEAFNKMFEIMHDVEEQEGALTLLCSTGDKVGSSFAGSAEDFGYSLAEFLSDSPELIFYAKKGIEASERLISEQVQEKLKDVNLNIRGSFGNDFKGSD